MSAPTPAPETPQGNVAPVVSSQAAGLAHTEQTDAVRSLAATLLVPDAVGAVMLKGTVTAVSLGSLPPVMSIQLGGDTATTITNVRFLDSYWPVVGDVVLVLKQGASLLGLGQVADGSTHTENGWIAPSLASGCATFANDPVLYRLIYDNGSKKIQLRGRITLTGTPTLMWTMPSELRPLLNMAPTLLARDPTGGSNVCQMDILANGSMNLVGTTTGVKASSGQQTGIGGGSAATSYTNTDHKHRSADQGPSSPPGDPVYSDWWTATVVWSFVGTNGVSHNHVGGDHQHPLDTVTAPGWVSFNGVEYFI